MNSITIPEIEGQLEKLSPDRLRVVYDFVSYLVERAQEPTEPLAVSDAFQTMLASEAVLREDWDSPEEDAAWAHL